LVINSWLSSGVQGLAGEAASEVAHLFNGDVIVISGALSVLRRIVHFAHTFDLGDI